MKIFFKYLMLFALPIIIMVLFFEFFLRNIESGYAQKRDGLITQKDSVEILILGTSHATDGINPTVFSRYAYNLAYGSQTLLYDHALLIKYAKQLPKLKYVIISIDYPSLYWGYVAERDFFYDHYYNINLQNNSFNKEKLSYFFYVYTPKTSLKLLTDNPKINYVKGWAGYDSTEIVNLSDAIAKERVAFFNNSIALSAKNNLDVLVRNELINMIVFLKNNNITPIIITAPCYKSFNKFLDPIILEKNKNFINKLTEQYKIRYLNFQFDSSFTQKDFHNVDHLNAAGAKKFSKKLDSALVTTYNTGN